MSPENIALAVEEARRFLDRHLAWEAAQAKGGTMYDSPRETGALRRASMDLTRALADMRKPPS